MYQYIWDSETGGLLLTSEQSKFSKEPRPVYYKELDILGFDRYWSYPRDDSAPIMWAEANNYIYRGRTVARTKGGSLYTAPEIIVLEDPEPSGAELQLVNVPRMCEKNIEQMETLVQETIKNVYNAYRKYKSKVDIFHVSFSGGKDSVVTLDIVQRAIPHNDFVVIFGDTGMEFPDTLDVIEKTKKDCELQGISFFITKAEENPAKNWRIFGPPSSAMRWCCSVHKTTPQLLYLRTIVGKDDITEMAFVGVRADESVRRSGYSFISQGSKQKGQFSCNPILEWSSAEVFLYIYSKQLVLNEAYKKGSSRAGCIYCPMATEKSDFLNRSMYPESIQPYIEIVKDMYAPAKDCPSLLVSYLENKGWKARKNGRDITNGRLDYLEDTVKDVLSIRIRTESEAWKEWIKTVGTLVYNNGNCTLSTPKAKTIHFTHVVTDDHEQVFTFKYSDYRSDVTTFKYIKNSIKKSTSCVACRHCEVNCPHGNICFDMGGRVHISDACIHCNMCNSIDDGCLVFSSLILPRGVGKMSSRSIDEYGTHPLKIEWLEQFVLYKDEFDEKQTKLGYAMVPMFKKYLRNAGLINKDNSWNEFTELFFKTDLQEEFIWALMMINLAYSSQVGWLVHNVKFDQIYTQKELGELLLPFISTKTGPKNIPNAYKHMSKTRLSSVGFGSVVDKSENGFLYVRKSWENPIPEVILYSLYKFAEACGDYYQFTLEILLDDTIERDGVSPTRIFGLDKDTMIRILNGLAVNYPDFISVSFTLDLDNITLRPDKSSADVLQLF